MGKKIERRRDVTDTKREEKREERIEHLGTETDGLAKYFHSSFAPASIDTEKMM